MKKTLALILTLALSLAALTGCGSKTETPADTNTDSSAQTEAPAALSGSVSTNGSTSMEKVIGALSEQFMADNSGVTAMLRPIRPVGRGARSSGKRMPPEGDRVRLPPPIPCSRSIPIRSVRTS